MPRGFESHRLRQRQHPAGCCFLFLRQTMQGLQGGIRTARARRFASRRAKMPRWGIFRARENPTVCAKYHYSVLHWVVIFLLLVCKIPLEAYIVSGVFWYKWYQLSNWGGIGISLVRLIISKTCTVEALLMRFISPIRPGRTDSRKLTQKPAVSFTYRVA